MDKCQCEKPTPWEDVRGKQTNVCEKCGKQIVTHRTPELGRLHTQLESALLGDHKLDSDHPFITYMAETIREDVRQRKLVWDANRAQETIRRKAREQAAAKPKPATVKPT